MTKVIPTKRDASWLFVSGPPQRYTLNFHAYVARGGLVKPTEDMLRFAPEGKGSGDSGRFWFFCLLSDQLAKEGLTGDFAEVGVYQGRTAALIATIARRFHRTAYLFDTFEGFSEADLTGIDAGRRKAFADTSLEAVRAHVGDEGVQYVKGFFPDSTSQIRDDLSFCLVHIDCDLYAPITSALEYFYPRMVPGGFIVVHDYASLGWAGAEKAVDDFFLNKVESVIPLMDGAGSAVIRKAKTPGLDNWRAQQIRSLLTGDWISAARNRLAPLLGAGWSSPESWGIWGVGLVHEIQLPTVQGGLEIELDVHAYLPYPHSVQEVEISAGGRTLTNWRFEASKNRGIRSVRVPDELAEPARNCLNMVTLHFRMREIFPNLKGDRPLGMACHRFLCRTLQEPPMHESF
jgi:hypothetical protein